MEKYLINGGKPLYGEVEISGAKNAAVAIIPAAIMVRGVCRLENLPRISDTDTLLRILRYMGAEVRNINRSTVELDCSRVTMDSLPPDIWALTRRIRASYYLIGAMLGRFGAACSTMPGGCNFGVRPIDQHIKGLNALGANVNVSGGYIQAKAKNGRLRGTRIYLDKVSVGATVNIMIAAATAEGRTVIENVAREPHIVDLANFLNSMGADVRGAGTDTVKVYGVEPEGAASMKAALENGGPVTLDTVNTIADGVAVKTVGDKVFPYVQKNLDGIITISDDELVGTYLDMMEKHKMVVENSGLLTVAALRHLDCADKFVVPILSGGNMDVITMSSLIQHGLIHRGRVFTFSVMLPDRPGELLRVAKIVAEQQGNIIRLEHNQFVSINRQAEVELRVTLEAFGNDHKEAIVRAMEAGGYAVRIVPAQATFA